MTAAAARAGIELRDPVTRIGPHYLLAHYDVPVIDPARSQPSPSH
jgi:hypothetical protein